MKPPKDQVAALHCVTENTANIKPNTVGRFAYATHPFTRILTIGIQIGGEVVVFDAAANATGDIAAAARMLGGLAADGHVFAAHDVPLQALLLRELLHIDTDNFFDTDSYRKYRRVEHGPSSNVSLLESLTPGMTDLNDPVHRNALVRQCATAVAETHAHAMQAVDDEQFPDWEWAAVAQACQTQLAGVHVDLNSVVALRRRVDSATAKVAAGLAGVGFSDAHVDDAAAVRAFVSEHYDVQLSSSSISNPEVIAARRDVPEIDRFFTLVKAGSALNKLMLQLQRLGQSNGRLFNHLHYYGSSTGRFTSGGHDAADFNLHGLPKTGVPAEVREVVIPPPGMAFLASDLKSIEPRVLAFLAGEVELVERFRVGEDVYTWFGQKIDRDAPRDIGKEAVISLGYGMGLKTFTQRVRAKFADIDDALVQRAYATFHGEFTRISDLAELMARAAKAAVSERTAQSLNGVTFESTAGAEPSMAVRLPTGRYLFYRGTGTVDKPALTFSRSAGTGALEVTVRAHTLLENIVQAIARDIMVAQSLELEAVGIKVAFTVHDEIVFVAPRCDCGMPDGTHMPECAWAAVRDTVTACMSKVPACFPALAGLPLDCEVNEAVYDRYAA